MTFSGKFGDQLWSLAGAKALHARGHCVDFATMGAYSKAHDLIANQRYIDKVFAIDGWVEESDQCAVQPWQPPSVPDRYDEVHHLTYRERPKEPLILNCFRVVPDAEPIFPILPFLEAPDGGYCKERYFSFSFNEMHARTKQNALVAVGQVAEELGVWGLDVGQFPFLEAAGHIKSSLFFLGCRSANYVIAHGLDKRILTIEPEPGRRETIFSCPWGREAMPDPSDLGTFMRIVKEWCHELS